MHKKIIENALSQLDAERVSYFGGIANSLEDDPRFEDNANLAFSVLKDIMIELPIYLEQQVLIELLLEFVNNNYQRLKKALYDPDFIYDPTTVRSVTGEFIHQVVMLSLEMHENGEIEESPLSVHKLTWPYRDTDVVDPDDEPDAWSDAIAKNEQWRLANGGVDRRRSGTARIDDLATEKAKEVEEREKEKAPAEQPGLKVKDI